MPGEVSQLRGLIRDIPDFPTPGIVFKDITPLLLNGEALDAAVTDLAELAAPLEVDYVLAPEARGFILGAALARELKAGFVPARRPGKLPHETVRAEYALEYGTGVLELHADALSGGARVLVHDDLLATGGTALALCQLVEGLGGTVAACAFLIELSFLPGRQRLAPREVKALISYEDCACPPPGVSARSQPLPKPCSSSWPTPTTCPARGRACSGWRVSRRTASPRSSRPRRAEPSGPITSCSNPSLQDPEASPRGGSAGPRRSRGRRLSEF